MLSFALVFLFLGTMYRGMEKPKFNMLFVLNCLILMALVLSHIVPTIALVFISPGLLLVNPRWRSLGYLAAVAAVGFALSAFWSIPFAANLQWTAHMAWDQLRWGDLGGWWLAPVGIPAIIGFLFAIVKKEKRLLPLLWMSVIVLVVYWMLPNGRLWNARIVRSGTCRCICGLPTGSPGWCVPSRCCSTISSEREAGPAGVSLCRWSRWCFWSRS